MLRAVSRSLALRKWEPDPEQSVCGVMHGSWKEVGRVGHTGLQAHAAAQVLDGMFTTGDVALLLAAGTQLRSALVQAARAERSVLQESGALGSLSLDVVTRVGRDDAGKTSQTSDEGGSELNHD